MFYVADTRALVKYIINKVPERISSIFESSEKGETIIFIPTIVLAECFYLIKRNKISLDFKQLLEKIGDNLNMLVVPFNIEILKLFAETNLTEIHDQIIVATAKHLGAALLTKDEEIKKSKEVKVILD